MKVTGDEYIDDWAWQQRRKGGLRLVAVGAAILVPALIWLIAYFNWDSDEPVTRIKAIGGITVTIGALILLAGLVTLWRARKRPMPEVPEAVARERRDD